MFNDPREPDETLSPTDDGGGEPADRASPPLDNAVTQEPVCPSQIGRYRVERLLGKGGFGLVYLAHDDQLQRQVAIKVPHRELTSQPADAEAYLDEARMLARLDHPHIVPVHDVGSTPEFSCFFVSKYIDGTSLAGRMEQSALTYAEAAELTATVAEALHCAHKQGLVHRDIKPGNILLDRSGKPYVVDFGLALKEAELGKGPRYPGTPAYMSPEQARGEGHRVDGRSDIYSLGAVLYQLLTGRRTFTADTRDELLQLIATQEPKPPRQVDDRIPKELERICLKALSRRASDRYTIAEEMAEDLRQFLAMSGMGRGRTPTPPATPLAWGVDSGAPRSKATTLSPTLQPIGDRSTHYFAIQREIIEEHCRGFVGRGDVLQSLDRFLAGNRRGYFIVRGGPGQGKSAVAAHLARSRNLVHHFISHAGGRSDPRLVLRSVLAQILPLAEMDVPLPETVPELTKTLEDSLTRLGGLQSRTVMVFDALDEGLPDVTVGLPFLVTEGLPDNTYIVVTTRPCDQLDDLLGNLNSVPHAIYDLGPLELADIAAILRRRRPDLSNAEVERIAENSQGNPLYLHALAAEWDRDITFDLGNLPGSIDEFYRRATGCLQGSCDALQLEVLGLLTAARKPLSLGELGELTRTHQRRVYEQAIRPIRPFLLEVNHGYGFYHACFREFVSRKLVYEDELPAHHRTLATWLQTPECRADEYRQQSLAYHLYEAGDRESLTGAITAPFLAEKVKRFGYAVLEDLELLTRAMLEAGEPRLVERCVELVEDLRQVVGSDIIEAASENLRGYRAGPAAFRSRVVSPRLPTVPGADVFVGMLPKLEVGADFFEVVPMGDRLVVALGDVAGEGLKSVFVARFVANLFRQIVEATDPLDLGRVLDQLNRRLSGHRYFEFLPMQCIALDPDRGLLAIANAGHPYPVLYSARRRQCDQLPVRGDPLNAITSAETTPARYEQRRTEVAPGDVLVMVSDGLTESHRLRGDRYGYRFMRLVEQQVQRGAKAVGQAILDDWRAQPRASDDVDDVTVIVLAIGRSGRSEVWSETT